MNTVPATFLSEYISSPMTYPLFLQANAWLQGSAKVILDLSFSIHVLPSKTHETVFRISMGVYKICSFLKILAPRIILSNIAQNIQNKTAFTTVQKNIY